MENWLLIITSVLASSGLWGVILYVIQRRDKRRDKDTAERKMLLALAHDRIYYLCEEILHDVADGERDGLTTDEYDNLRILYEGYKALGGNGTCERLFGEVSKLPISAGRR